MLPEIPSTGEVNWGEWILGFARAVGPRPAARARIKACNEPEVVEAVKILEGLAGVAAGEIEEVEKRFARIEPYVPAVICSVVSVVNGRERSKGANAAERIEPRAPGTAGAKTGPDPRSGWGLKWLYHRLLGIH